VIDENELTMQQSTSTKINDQENNVREVVDQQHNSKQ